MDVKLSRTEELIPRGLAMRKIYLRLAKSVRFNILLYYMKICVALLVLNLTQGIRVAALAHEFQWREFSSPIHSDVYLRGIDRSDKSAPRPYLFFKNFVKKYVFVFLCFYRADQVVGYNNFNTG